MMKKFFLLIASLIFLALPSSAFAHILKTDGSIGAVLHVDPNDAPVAGKQASLIFEFKNSKGAFNLADCTCNLAIFAGDKSVSTQQIYSIDNSNPSTAVISYTFPNPNVYTIKVTGTATNNSFANFSLKYDVRVEKAAANTSANNFFNKYFPLLAFGFIFIIIVGIFITNRKPKSKGDKHEKKIINK